jgi:hypothetical protein
MNNKQSLLLSKTLAVCIWATKGTDAWLANGRTS